MGFENYKSKYYYYYLSILSASSCFPIMISCFLRFFLGVFILEQIIVSNGLNSLYFLIYLSLKYFVEIDSQNVEQIFLEVLYCQFPFSNHVTRNLNRM